WLDNLAFDDGFTFTDTDIALSSSNVSESVDVGTVVGDIIPSDTSSYTYSLVAGTGDTDNALFTLNGNQLKTNAVFDYETQTTHSIRVQVKRIDGGDCVVAEKTLTISIDNVNEIPIAGFGSALNFDGVDDYIDLGTLNGEILGNDARTFEAWIKTSMTSTATILRYGADASMGRITWRAGGGKFSIEMRGKQTVWSTPALGDGNWHHIAWSYSAGDNLNQGLLYLDGVALTTITNAGVGGSTEGTIPPNTQSGNAYIGSTDPSTHLFAGQIDEVRLWNTARSQAEIQANMYTPLTGSETGLVSYWDFEDEINNKASDLTNNHNNGILTNMDTSVDRVEGIIGQPTFVTSVTSILNDILPAYDGDGDGLTFSIVDDDGGAAVMTDVNSGAFTYTPAVSGSRTFSYKVNDGISDSNTVTVKVEVMPNLAPIAGQGSALNFTGSSEYISLGTLTGEILSNNARTFEAWIKTTSTDVSPVFKYGDDTSPHRIQLSTRDRIIRIDLYAKITEWSAPNINDGNWHHIAWSYTAGSRVSESFVYVDGELLTTVLSNVSNDYPDTQTGVAYIGTQNGSVYFDGQIDEVRLWNTARTQAEIQANMYDFLTGSETGLVSYWGFEEATGTTANDLNASNANHGTLTGMTDSNWIAGVIGSPTFTTSLSTPISDILPAYDNE
ncbi:MAG: LamG-like jellyroll fold domain-containing protein, partial [Thiotrichaceae bacterium]|nr:LamG-like jellyroll fold domain-containing protein [Thiotrichaceae bacterium]